MFAAVDLHQLANAIAPMAGLVNTPAPPLAVEPQPPLRSAIIHLRKVSLENAKPCSAASFSAASVGPKSA
jgi:hypothetical protein